MALEIERKFLVQNDSWREQIINKTYFKQAYLSTHKERTVRVRIEEQTAFLTIKGISCGAARQEFEYAIPLSDAQQLLLLCETPVLEKYRYIVELSGKRWEIDEFLGVNQGLIIAEIELTHEQELFSKPLWLGNEVTDDKRYFNSYLSLHPFLTW